MRASAGGFTFGLARILDSQWENFKLFGLIYYAYPKKFELFWAWLLKKRGIGFRDGSEFGFRAQGRIGACDSRAAREPVEGTSQASCQQHRKLDYRMIRSTRGFR